MKEPNKKVDKKLGYDTYRVKILRILKNHHSLLYNILYFFSLGMFLFYNVILSLGSIFIGYMNAISWFYLLFIGGCIIFVALSYYFAMYRQLSFSQLKSFKILSTLIFFVAGMLVNYIPNLLIYPGRYIVGFSAIVIYVLMSILFISKKIIRINKHLEIDSIKASLEEEIFNIKKRIKICHDNFENALEAIERSQNFDNSNEIFKKYLDNLDNYERLIFRKKQLHLIENDPKTLRKLVKIKSKNNNEKSNSKGK